jgi:hypothetical protein
MRLWAAAEDRVVRRYARAFLAGRYPSAREATAACLREVTERSSHTKGTRIPSHTFHGFYERLLSVARDLGMPYLHLAWTPDERRALLRYSRMLFTGHFRYTRDAASACRQRLAELGRRVENPPDGSRRRPPRSDKAVYHELTRMVAQAGLPRHKAPWTKPELEILERYARATERGKFKRWNDAAEASMTELKRLYARVGTDSTQRAAKLAGRRASDAEQQIRVLAKRLHLGGPHTQRWTPPEERILRKWVKLYHEGHQPGRRGPIRAVSEGLRDELRNAGFTRLLSACRYRLIEGRRKVYGIAYPPPRRWTPEEDKVADSWARWYDRNRRTRRLEPYKTATEGLQEDLAKMHSDRSLFACRLRLLKRHRRLHGLA